MKIGEIREKSEKLKGILGYYGDFTGVTFQKTGDNSLRIVFAELNPGDAEEACSADITLFNDNFLVSDMTPHVRDYYDFVQYLSVYRDLKTFLRVARKSFIAHFSRT